MSRVLLTVSNNNVSIDHGMRPSIVFSLPPNVGQGLVPVRNWNNYLEQPTRCPFWQVHERAAVSKSVYDTVINHWRTVAVVLHCSRSVLIRLMPFRKFSHNNSIQS